MKFQGIDWRSVKPKGIYLSLFYGFLGLYILFNSLTGERGIISWMQQSSEFQQTQQELQQFTARRENLELKVSRLSGNAIDLDLLEEEARRSLGKSKSTEMVVILK